MSVSMSTSTVVQHITQACTDAVAVRLVITASLKHHKLLEKQAANTADAPCTQ